MAGTYRTFYHIGRDNRPAICNAASPSRCPLGGRHYDTFDAALRAAEKRNKRMHDDNGGGARRCLSKRDTRPEYEGEITEYDGVFDLRRATSHMREAEHLRRFKLAYSLCKVEKARPLRGFEWDRGHENGAEIHWVMDNGVIFVVNKRTGKFVTVLIGRPAQVKRYYEAIGEQAPRDTLAKAKQHEERGYNNR